MRSLPWLAALALAASATGCTLGRPAWYSAEPHRQRESAYDWFLVASGAASKSDRESSCGAAADTAWRQIAQLFIAEVETQSDVVAVAGGPSRVPALLDAYLERAVVDALRTQEAYDDGGRRCYVELRWRLPRHLATSISRTLELADTEESVGEEIKRALAPDGVTPQKMAAPTPEAAVSATYRGWFIRLIDVPDCDSHRLAFVGAPGGGEARWLELKRGDSGWAVVDDRQAGESGWPVPPDLALCD